MIRFAEGNIPDDGLRGVSASDDGIVESLVCQPVCKTTGIAYQEDVVTLRFHNLYGNVGTTDLGLGDAQFRQKFPKTFSRGIFGTIAYDIVALMREAVIVSMIVAGRDFSIQHIIPLRHFLFQKQVIAVIRAQQLFPHTTVCTVGSHQMTTRDLQA